MIHDVAVSIQVQGGKPTAATIPVKELDPAERGGRAFKVAGGLAAIGLGSVFVPIVHFFLPWIMLVSAIVAYVRIRSQGAMIQTASVCCPNCGGDVKLTEQPATWPIEWNCLSCRKRLTIKLTAPALD